LIGRTFNVVNLGYVVDSGAYSAPDPPHNPNPPRYSRATFVVHATATTGDWLREAG
jgi:hypothetical protein